MLQLIGVCGCTAVIFVGSYASGWTDPILANAYGAGSMSAKVRLAFAWPNATAPFQIYNKTAAELSHKDDLLIFERNVTTGKAKSSELPLQVIHNSRLPMASVDTTGSTLVLNTHSCTGHLTYAFPNANHRIAKPS